MEKWLRDGVKRAREQAMYVAGIQRMGHYEAMAYANLCEGKYMAGVNKIRTLVRE